MENTFWKEWSPCLNTTCNTTDAYEFLLVDDSYCCYKGALACEPTSPMVYVGTATADSFHLCRNTEPLDVRLSDSVQHHSTLLMLSERSKCTQVAINKQR